ncbi:MAG: hypothetical protein ABIS38_09150 [Sphingomicrobium sp.]
MTFRNLLGALLIGAVAAPAAAQDAQSLLAKNLEARGGAAAIAAIKTISFTGRTLFPGDFELSFQATSAEIDGSARSRVDLGIQGLTIVSAYDGSGGWRINPFQGRKDAEKMGADEARSQADSALIEGPLLASRSDGSKVTYLGREDFDGTLAYKLKVAQKDGDEFVFWLDPDTYLEIKIEESRRIRGAQTNSETELGDYEKIAGVYFPMSVESWGQGHPDQRQRTILASGAANGPVSASYFAEPRAGAAPGTLGGADASDKPQGKPDNDAPTAETTPASPPKGN